MANVVLAIGSRCLGKPPVGFKLGGINGLVAMVMARFPRLFYMGFNGRAKSGSSAPAENRISVWLLIEFWAMSEAGGKRADGGTRCMCDSRSQTSTRRRAPMLKNLCQTLNYHLYYQKAFQVATQTAAAAVASLIPRDQLRSLPDSHLISPPTDTGKAHIPGVLQPTADSGSPLVAHLCPRMAPVAVTFREKRSRQMGPSGRS